MSTEIERLNREIAELKERAREKRAALKRSTAGLQESMQQLHQEAERDVHRITENVQNTLSIEHQIKSHPSGALVSAFAVGVASAFLLPGGGLPKLGASLGRMSSTYMKGAFGSTLLMTAFDALRGAAESKAPSGIRPAVDRLFDRLRSDLHLERRGDTPRGSFNPQSSLHSGRNGSKPLNE
jgi:hypothetical protein